jgi:DNA-binding NtrC family response regulator
MTITPLRSALIVDSVPEQGAVIKTYFDQLGFEAETITEHARAFECLANNGYELAVVEMTGGKACDFELLQYITRNLIKTAAIATAGQGNSRLGPKALEKGARSFLVKPFALEDLSHCVRHAMESQKHAEEAERLARRRQQERRDRQIIGSSPAIRSVLDLIGSLADSPYTTVLIKGESGTGKDLVANAIHDATFGDHGPLNAVNCAAIPAELIESELFGYEKGAFTGAFQSKRGIVELTDGGTLFLDEIAELPLGLQPKLLRFLDEKCYRRVGGGSDMKVSLRVIAATNRNIEKMVDSGSFRRDLYFRLSGFPITLPPLRDRAHDVIDLARFLVERCARRYGKKTTALSPALEELLGSYPWPGNIRELKNVLERAVIISEDETIDVHHIQFDANSSRPLVKLTNPSEELCLPLGRPFFKEIAYYEKELIERAIKQSDGVKSSAARLLGISRYAFDRLIKRVDKLTGENVTC